MSVRSSVFPGLLTSQLSIPATIFADSCPSTDCPSAVIQMIGKVLFLGCRNATDLLTPSRGALIIFLEINQEFSLPKIAIKPSLADARNQNCFNMSTVFNLPIPGLIAIPYLVFTSNWCWWSNVTQAQFSLYFRVVSSILASASSLVFASGTCCSNLFSAISLNMKGEPTISLSCLGIKLTLDK